MYCFTYKRFFLIAVFIFANTASAVQLTLTGPELPNDIQGHRQLGIVFSARHDVTLESFVFNNQGGADVITLKDENGNTLETYNYAGGDFTHQVNISWPLSAGQKYFLSAQNQNESNGKWGTANFPVSNAHIKVEYGKSQAAPNGTSIWFSFTDLITEGPDVPEFEPGEDNDSDGIPNAVEFDVNTDLEIKDNDIFNDSRLFAMQMYRDFLYREGENTGIDFWVDTVNSGALSKIKVVEKFFDSAEFSELIAPISRLYYAYFSRIPDYEGLLFHIGSVKSGVPLSGVSEQFAQSPEFVNTYGALSNEDFVTTVYSNVLNRAPDSEGLQYWKTKLDNNEMTRGEMMIGFSESDEFKASNFTSTFVTMMYVGMLRRTPELDGFNFWKDSINSGVAPLDLIDDFFYSQEYHNRFLP